MDVRFHTNLDLAQPYVHELNDVWGIGWVKNFHAVPNKGDRISFPFTKSVKSSLPGDLYSTKEFSFELEVCSVSYDAKGRWVKVELHIPSYQSSWSILEWEEWFQRHTAGRIR